MTAFWDASALAPLCVPGRVDLRTRRVFKENAVAAWWGAAVEIAGAVARLRREGHVTAAQADSAGKRLDMLRRSWREVQPVPMVRDLAMEQIVRYDLRAADALQLAAALVWCKSRPARRLFVCADRRLAAAARQAGFTVVEA